MARPEAAPMFAGRMPALPGRAARRSAPTIVLAAGRMPALPGRAARRSAPTIVLAAGRMPALPGMARPEAAPSSVAPLFNLSTFQPFNRLRTQAAWRGRRLLPPCSRAGSPRSQGGPPGGRPLPLCLSRAGCPRSQGGGRSHHVRGQDARAPRKLSARAHRTNGVLGEHALLKRLAGTARLSRMWQRRTLCELFRLCAIMHAFFSCLLRAFILQLGLSPAMFPF